MNYFVPYKWFSKFFYFIHELVVVVVVFMSLLRDISMSLLHFPLVAHWTFFIFDLWWVGIRNITIGCDCD